jgi:hypothetical protein
MRLRDAAEQAGCGEALESDRKHAPTAEEVAEPAAEQQEPSERQRVGVDDPLQPDLAVAELAADRRQRKLMIDTSSMTMNCAAQISVSTAIGPALPRLTGRRRNAA